MANKKITDLSAATALGGTELFEAVQSSTSVKASASQIKTYVGNSLNITGGVLGSVTISNAVGEFDSITVTAGAVPFNTITNRSQAQFISTRDQTATSANVSYAVSFDTASAWNSGITMASSTNITFAAAGVYECSMNFHFNNADSSDHLAYVWYALNGTNVPNSGSKMVVPKTADGGSQIFELNFQEQVTAGQYLTLYWQTDNANVSVDYVAAAGNVPGVPSVFFIANRIA